MLILHAKDQPRYGTLFKVAVFVWTLGHAVDSASQFSVRYKVIFVLFLIHSTAVMQRIKMVEVPTNPSEVSSSL